MELQSQGAGLSSEILSGLKELGVSLVNHGIWARKLHRSLLCNCDPDESDFREDAHHHCRFGQWYYSTENPRLLELEGFKELEEQHKQVHANARGLLVARRDGKEISPEMYDQFTDTVHIFRTTVQSIQYEIVSEVCTLDQLTGVWNRYAMTHRINQEIELARRHGRSGAIALIDFDHFKKVNDQHGHIIGDAVLKNIISYMGEQIRKSDSIFRYGGEEFLFLLPNTGLDSAVEVLERLRRDIKNIPTPTDNAEEIFVSISIGMTGLDGQKTDKEIIDCADRALLTAKANGRDRLEVWQ